jgi:hypothetical protein
MKKITLEYIHLCEMALLDVTQKLSLIGLFENFNFRQLPSTYPRFSVVASVRFAEGAPKDHPVRMTIVNADGTIGGKADFVLKNQGMGVAILSANFANQEFRMPGEHKIEVWVGDERVATKPFSVTLVEQKPV